MGRRIHGRKIPAVGQPGIAPIDSALVHTPDMSEMHVLTTASPGLSAYYDACDQEDEILSTQNVRAWVDEFATSFNFLESDFVLRGVGAGGERIVGALSYVGRFCGEIAARSTDYNGRKVVLVFTAAVSPLGLDSVAAQCRALGAESIEAWGCAAAFGERRTSFIDSLRIINKCHGDI